MLGAVFTAVIWWTGLFTIAVGLRRLASFLHIYTLHSSTVQRYLTDEDDAFALVTGASDGLGKEIVKDLYERGYHIMLHGRNPEKLAKVKEELLASSVPKREVKIFVANAVAQQSWDFSPLKGIRFTAIFLVAGGSHPTLLPVDEMTDDAIDWTIRYNATFHTSLLRYIIPSLRASKTPAFIVGIGSLLQYHPPPFLTIYAASKEYLSKFLHGLETEHTFIDPSLDISIQFMPVGEFVSPSHVRPISYFCPSSATMARAVISAVGCGHRDVVPYFGHFLQTAALWIVGRRRSDKLVSDWMVKAWMNEGQRSKEGHASVVNSHQS